MHTLKTCKKGPHFPRTDQAGGKPPHPVGHHHLLNADGTDRTFQLNLENPEEYFCVTLNNRAGSGFLLQGVNENPQTAAVSAD